MGAVAVRASRPSALLLSPVLVRQGAQVRRETPVLPEAAGARRGEAGAGRPLDLLVVGESTAAGVGVERQGDGLAAQLAGQLAARAGRRVRWRLAARTGATAGHVLRRLVPQVAGPVDVAVVVLGVNDALRLRGRRTWRRDVAGVVAALEGRLRPGGLVVLAGVPQLGRFPALPQPLRAVLGLHARGLDRELARLASGRPRVVHAPVPPLGAGDLAADQFHPGAGAYRRWAGQLADVVVARLG